MRLYTTPTGKWAGTQADAKKLGGFCEAEVPTMKADLLAFLNDHQVVFGVYTALGYETPTAPTRQPTAPKVSDDDYNSVRTYLETCDAQELNRCLTIICSRLHDFLD